VQDCADVWGGTAVVDECGTCDSDATNDCVQDCADVWGGTAVVDECGTCDSDATNDCVQDCAENWGGTAVVDECGTCDSDATNDCVQDCADVWGGDAVTDDCGVCDSDSANDNTTCVQDCADVWGGSGEDDDSDGYCNDDDDCPNTASGEAVNSNGCSESQLSISQVGTVLPEEFSIAQNFPNPFNPVTSITFDVAEMDEISLIVYDLTGKEVAMLVSGTYTPGTYKVEWNAVNNAGDGIVSGMYIYRYISSEKAITRKMLYLK
jgi:hypothetical protein